MPVTRPLTIGLALSGVVLLVLSAFMPWLTIDLGFGTRITFNLIDFLNLVDFSNRNAGQVLQTIQSTLHLNAIPPNAVLVKDTVFFLLSAVAIYALAMGTAIVSLYRPNWLLSSGVLGIMTALFGIAGIETLKGHVSAEGEIPEYAVLVRPDYGIYLAIIAGFFILGAYLIVRQFISGREAVVQTATMFCRECGAKIPRDSRFCKECGAKLV